MKKFLLLLVSFQLAAFVIYRNGVIDHPKYDHSRLLLLRESVSSEWEWFLFLVHHRDKKDPRRVDHFLFRPGLYVVMATVDYFFRERLAVVGAIGLAWHGLAALSLYLVLRLLLGRVYAFLVAMVFTAYFPGLELANWRHISPYLLSLAGWGGGFWLWWRAAGHPRERLLRRISGGLLLVACLFYEVVMLSLVLLLLVLFLLRPRFPPAPGTPDLSRRLIRHLAVVLAVYSAGFFPTLDYAALPDFLATLIVPAGRDFTSDKVSTPFPQIRMFTGNTLRAFVTAPWLRVVPPDGNPEYGLRFIFRGTTIGCWALLFWGGVGILAWRGGRSLRTHGAQPGNVLALYAAIGPGVHGVITGVREFALDPSGAFSHLSFATYHHGVMAYFLCLGLGFFLARRRQEGRSGWGRLPGAGMALLLFFYGTLGAYRISGWLDSSLPARKKFAGIVENTAAYLAEHPEYYFAGVLPLPVPGNVRPPLPGYYPYRAMLQRYAEPGPEKRPLFLCGRKEYAWLVTAEFKFPPDARPIELGGLSRVVAKIAREAEPRREGKTPRNGAVLLFRKNSRVLFLRVEFPGSRTEGAEVVFDYRHPGKYHLVKLGSSLRDDVTMRTLTWYNRGSGKIVEQDILKDQGNVDLRRKPGILWYSHYFPPSGPLRLEILRTTSAVLIFRNDRLAMFMPVDRWGGRMALTGTDLRSCRTLVMGAAPLSREAIAVEIAEVLRVWPPLGTAGREEAVPGGGTRFFPPPEP